MEHHHAMNGKTHVISNTMVYNGKYPTSTWFLILIGGIHQFIRSEVDGGGDATDI